MASSKEYLAGLFKAMYDELPVHRRNIDCCLFLFYTSSKLKLTTQLDMDRRWDHGIQNNR